MLAGPNGPPSISAREKGPPGLPRACVSSLHIPAALQSSRLRHRANQAGANISSLPAFEVLLPDAVQSLSQQKEKQSDPLAPYGFPAIRSILATDFSDLRPLALRFKWQSVRWKPAAGNPQLEHFQQVDTGFASRNATDQAIEPRSD